MTSIWSLVRRDLRTTGAAGVALLGLFLGVMLNRYRIEGLPLRPQPEHAALGFALVVLAWLFLTKRARFPLQWTDGLLVLYLALALLSSALFPANALASVQYWTRMSSSVAVYFVARWLIESTDAPTAVNLGFKVLLVWGVVEGLLGIAAWFLYPFGVNLGVDEYPLGIRGPGGILCNFSLTTYVTLWEPNVFGGVMMFIILIAAVLFVSKDFTRWRKHLGIAMAVMLVALALNASRGALGTLAIGLILVLLLGQGMRFAEKLRWLIGAVILVVAVIVPSLEVSRTLMQLPTAPGLAERAPCAEWIAAGMPRGTTPGDPDYDPNTGPESGSSAVNRIFEGQTLASRWVSYQNAWQDFLKRPVLGNGADSFGQVYTTTAHTPGWISNMVLMSLHDTGIVGTLVLGAWFLAFGWGVFSTLRRVLPSPHRTLMLALAIGLVCVFITYQVTTLLWFGLVWFWLAVMEASLGRFGKA